MRRFRGRSSHSPLFPLIRTAAVTAALIGGVLGAAVPSATAAGARGTQDTAVAPYSTEVAPTVADPQSATAAELAAAPAPEAPPASLTTAGGVQALSVTDGSISRAEMVARGEQWVSEGVPYSQTAYWTDSGGTYRQDCSGFVSMAWHLGTSRTTYTLPDVSTELSSLDVLQPGDMIDTNSTMEHVVLFEGWTSSAHTTAVVLEEAHTGTDAREAQYSRSYLTANGFTPYRYDHVLDHPQYTNGKSGKCLSVSAGGSTDDGAAIIQWTCNGGPEQQWQWSGGRLVNWKSGKCLSVTGGGSTDDGAAIIQWTCNGGPEQQWTFHPHTGEWSNGNGKYLSVSGGGSTADGAAVIQWSQNGGAEQKWSASTA